MNNPKLYAATRTKLNASFTVQYEYQIQFTSGLFDPENTLIKEYFQERQQDGGQHPKLLFMIDQGLADHFPDLTNQIKRYCTSIPSIELIEQFYIFPGGERVKNDRETQESMLKAIDYHKVDRHSYVIAIGGGAFLDTAGYAAAISHRGVRHIRIPTTVLSQNDSGIGVKNGINYFNKKNYLGSFTPPDAVWNDIQFLSTLSERDKRAGLAEAVKVALIRDQSFFHWLEEHAVLLGEFETESLQSSIVQCARLHLQHITTNGDPFEKGSARPLDFGHWAAHKLEDLTHYEIRHGEAVAVGIMLDTMYSWLMGYINEDTMIRIRTVFDHLGFGSFYNYLSNIECNALLIGLEEFREHLGGQLTITLLKGIGNGFEVHEIDADRMEEAFHLLTSYSVANGN